MRIAKDPSKKLKGIGTGLLWVAAAVLLFAVPLAFGADGKKLGDMGQNLGAQAEGVGTGLKMLFYSGGFLFAGLGLVKLIGSFKTQEPKGASIGMFTLGAFLLALPFFINSINQTVADTDANTGLEELGIGN